MMIYYDSSKNLKQQIENSLNDLKSQINIKKIELEILLECLKHLNSIIQDTNNIDNPTELINLLHSIKSNLDNSRTVISDLENLKNILEKINTEITDTTNIENNNTLIYKLDNYNELVISLKSKLNTLNYEHTLLNYIKSSNFVLPTCLKTEPINPITENTSISSNTDTYQNSKPAEKNNISNNTHESSTIKFTEEKTKPKTTLKDNNTLTISEIRNTVFLPYSIPDLEKQLEKNTNYENIQEIINTEYIIPLSQYKNLSLSRFRETYNLMRKKEHASITNSLDLALELTFNNLLHPAIITACKNLDELDIYLNCLSANELNDFKIFNIKYEILPKK